MFHLYERRKQVSVIPPYFERLEVHFHENSRKKRKSPFHLEICYFPSCLCTSTAFQTSEGGVVYVNKRIMAWHFSEKSPLSYPELLWSPWNVTCSTLLKQKRVLSGKLLLTQSQKYQRLNLVKLVFWLIKDLEGILQSISKHHESGGV